VIRAALLTLLLALPLRAELTRYWTGNHDIDAAPRLHGPVLILAGGGGDQTEAMQAAVDAIRGCSECERKVDAVVLRASGGAGYNPYLMKLRGVNSVVSMVITDRDSASRPDVEKIVRMAELVFFAGGDQCNYIRWIKGTPVAEAVKSVFRRGGAVGGTSAGLAIMGEIAYDACPSQSAQSKEVLADPFHVDVSLSRQFFDWPVMADIITDTHFQQRDRLGRLLVFMARTLHDGPEKRVIGLGVSERTVLLVGRDGVGRVYGDGPVHLVVADRRAEVLERGKPLTLRGVRIRRFEKGDTLDLKRIPESGYRVIEVVEGKLTENPY
jgi:cyanophycinase